MHVHTQTFSRLPQSSFQVNMALVCFCSQHCIDVCVELFPFSQSETTTQTTMTLAYNTQQITKFLAIQPVRCRVWHSGYRSTFWFMTAIANSFCAIKAMHVFALIMSSKRCGRNSMHAHVQLSCIYLLSILDLTHVIKYGESLGRRLGYRPCVVETSFSLII